MSIPEGMPWTLPSHLFLSIKLNGYLLIVIALLSYLLYYFGARKPQISDPRLRHNSTQVNHQENAPLDAQIKFTKRPLLYMNRLGSGLKSSLWFQLLCGILLLAGFDVLTWMMTVSCVVVTGFVLYGLSLLKKRQDGTVNYLVKDQKGLESIDLLNQNMGSDISLIDDALGEVIGNCKNEKKSLIIVGVGLGSVLKRLEQSEYMNQFESVKVLEPNEKIVKSCQEQTQKIEYLTADYSELSKYGADIVLVQVEYLKHLDGKSISSLIKTCRNIAKVGLIIGDLQRSNFIDMLSLLNVGYSVWTHDLRTLNEWNNYLSSEIKVEYNQISSIWTFGRITLMVSGNN